MVIDTMRRASGYQGLEIAMTYHIRKIDVNATTKTYAGMPIEAGTFSALRKTLVEQADLSHGRGADVLDAQGDVLFHTADFEGARNHNGNGVTLEQIIEHRDVRLS
ncbi:Uncharacterised protein [Bordetella ansorpii]|uniref:Uncharacterized protein n=1 Tax=Bordetella ansorpii TaxID=288768 RepID=A0A157RLN2_9BORD|nr:hypothetical protein [Bordetella ansorpii]SAI58865.1 Uncharacterised protein [Bordetella ansorpii]